ncbi:hypothetical protein HYFRA_00000115 [Hymenoscyphus fraxineus]|uniref:Uncharacterized protein n=1 Tax=Hymenoscyphus fraxineus TaxID=746836 RepID=A0A9N9L6A3_9HELO|nr:hypothetical protein HYFRA_00000115 [Hymenoscyphus fraxineus]
MKFSPILLVALAGSVIAHSPPANIQRNAAPEKTPHANVQRNAAPEQTPPPAVRPREPDQLEDQWNNLVSKASAVHTSVFGQLPTSIPPLLRNAARSDYNVPVIGVVGGTLLAVIGLL